MPLSFRGRRVGDITVVTCRGQIIHGADSAALQEHLGRALPHERFVILDLTDVNYVDSSGLGLLVRLVNSAQAAGGDVKFCGVSARIAEVLKITRLQSVLVSYPTEAEAVAAFYEPRKDAPPRFVCDILCVAMSPDLLAYVGEVLRQDGYGVLTAANLTDALVLLRSSRPKTVVIESALRAMRDNHNAQAFNDLLDAMPVVELSTEFPDLHPVEGARWVLERVHLAIGTAAG